MYNAFYYEDNYYLLPDGYSDCQSFIDAVRQGSLPMEFCAVALRENHNVNNSRVVKGCSMAPYFLTGYHDESCQIVISNVEDVYPVHATLLSQEAYNAKLRELILEKCPGCLRYSPLSNRVQSLNGHFEEMSLDGVCLFRQETRPEPRSFRRNLFSLGGFYRNFNYFNSSASQMLENLKWLYTRYANAQLIDHGQQKVLILTGRKKELLLPIVTKAISEYLYSISTQAYRIEYTDPVTDMKSWLKYVLSDEKQEVFQKECKKYGVSIGVMEYTLQASKKIHQSLKPLEEHFLLFPLLQDEGKTYYLLSDTPDVLKALRYRTPLLQTYDTAITVYSQYGNRRYQISYDMRHTEL